MDSLSLWIHAFCIHADWSFQPIPIRFSAGYLQSLAVPVLVFSRSPTTKKGNEHLDMLAIESNPFRSGDSSGMSSPCPNSSTLQLHGT